MRFLLIILCFISFEVKAQENLVFNGDFELHDSCPHDLDQIRYAKYWDAIDTNYVIDSIASLGYRIGDFFAEYVNKCDSGYCAIPHNRWFNHDTRTGNGMVFAVWYFDNSFVFPGLINYVQGRLVHPLEAGRAYCVTFYVNSQNDYALSNIGAYFDDATIDTTHDPANLQPQYTPQVVDTNVIADSIAWTKIQGSFVANGTERFVTLGVFEDTGHFRHIQTRLGLSAYGMYLVEDVSVIPLDAVATAGRDTTITIGDTVRLGPPIHAGGLPVYWYKLGSTRPFDSTGNVYVHPDTSTSYVMMLDKCGEPSYDTVTVNVGNLSVKELTRSNSLQRYSLYPNPNNGVFTVRQVVNDDLNAVITISDLAGKVIYSGNNSFLNGKVSLQLPDVATGMYIVHIVDEKGNTTTLKTTINR